MFLGFILRLELFTGFSRIQWKIIVKVVKWWKLDVFPLRDIFIVERVLVFEQWPLWLSLRGKDVFFCWGKLCVL